METVLVGLSGGVDSSVAALLLKQAGYDVIGVTMSIWRKRDDITTTCSHGGCYGPDEEEDIKDAECAAEKIGIPYYVFDCADEYEKIVLDNFKQEYISGRTPNPCIRCNASVKFGVLPYLAKKHGIMFDKFATGHYARVEKDTDSKFTLKSALSANKDQSYFLYRLKQKTLSSVILPLGIKTKDEIRAIAKSYGLKAADKPDSQDFYGGNYNELLKIPAKRGNIVNMDGKILGEHNGIWNYTIGQRRGLCVSAPKPLYVLELRPETNEVVAGYADETFKKALYADDISLVKEDLELFEHIINTKRITAKTRSTQKPVNVRVYLDNDIRIRVEFDDLQKSITPGQSVVLYDNEIVLGGGIINEIE